MIESLPTRLIVCVDGTWCTADGQHGNNHKNNSNIYRFCASVKEGEAEDSFGNKFIQKKRYLPGIGSKDDIALFDRLQTGIFGAECIKQIKEVYELCCMLAPGPLDEVWLYGFSRGAYVVRAVAGLLHYLRALTSAGSPAFNEDYKLALKIHDYFCAKTRPAPKIQFLGAFDTVKAVSDRSLYDISFNASIKHLRHALALNENRKDFHPEYLYPEFSLAKLRERSFVQAWFLGAHIDLGGSAAKDGLSLYPLQWMFLESRSKGLGLEFDSSFSGRVYIDNPLNVIFPEHVQQGKGEDLWCCKVENGVVVEMQDLRKVHKLVQYKQRYKVQVNKHHAAYWTRRSRDPFNKDGELKGYCEYAPQGTILHPSVYLVFDEYFNVLLDSKDLTYRKDIEQWRSKILSASADEFWHDDEVRDIERPESIRILVCGNVGVGKSTLINKVFGVKVTESNDRERGVHDITAPFTTENRPDLLIHDSSGFEAGGLGELEAVKKFVSDRSEITEIKDRLHLIWFCLELSSARTKQKGTIELFKTVSQYAKDVPIVVVATKKDEFLAVKSFEGKDKISATGKDLGEYFAELDAYAENEYLERMKLIEKELREIKGGRFDAAVAVSMKDDKTIDLLTETTSSCFNIDKVRLLYISAQVTRIDLKIELAVAETIRIYRHTVRSMVAAGFVPGGASTTRVTVAAVVCKTIVTCFGVPTVSWKTVQQILNSVIWEDMDQNVSLLIAELIAGAGLGTFLITGAPVFLASGVINAPLIIPATTRLFLMLACDVILILVRAFKASTDKCIGQPLQRDIEKAAYDYCKISKAVHKRIKKVVPRHNMIKSFQANRIKLSLDEILAEYKELFTKGMGEGVDVKGFDEDESDCEASNFGDSEKMDDFI